jgi:hypothetical protein
VDAVKEIVMTIARRAKMGPSVEDALDKMKAPNPPPDQMAHEQQLEQMKGQQTAQLEQMKAQTQAQQHALELQQDAQAAEAQGQRDMQLEQWKQEMQARQVQHQNELEAQRAAAESQLNAQLEQQKQRHESYIKQQELDFERWKTELVEANKMAIAQISAKSAVDNTLLKAEQTANTEVSEELDDEPSAIDKLASMHGEAMQRMEQLMMHMTKPRTIQRGPDGKVIGVQ